MNTLRPPVLILVGSLDKHDEEDDDNSDQLHPDPQKSILFELLLEFNQKVLAFFVLLLDKEIHIKDPAQDPVEIGWSS